MPSFTTNGAGVYAWLTRCTLILVLSGLNGSVLAAQFEIGSFYFPGWKDHQPGAPAPMPWKRIQDYPEKEPLLGWYREGDVDVARTHIDWMADHGLSFVVYDAYWSKDEKSFLQHGVRAYLKAPNRKRLKFALLWANHTGTPQDKSSFIKMMDFFIADFLDRPEYLRINNEPVFFVMSAALLKTDAARFGSTPTELLTLAQQRARSAGLPGIHFVAGAGAGKAFLESEILQAGYASVSAYNYQRAPGATRTTRGYTERDESYRQHWAQITSSATAPLIVPMTSGWDKRPWGGSDDPEQDPSLPTPAAFEDHLMAARRLMQSGNPKVRRMGVICCWNEFGEGSYIEPTKAHGFEYLKRIKRAFTP